MVHQLMEECTPAVQPTVDANLYKSMFAVARVESIACLDGGCRPAIRRLQKPCLGFGLSRSGLVRGMRLMGTYLG